MWTNANHATNSDARVVVPVDPVSDAQCQNEKDILPMTHTPRTLSGDEDVTALVAPGVAPESMGQANNEETLGGQVMKLLGMGFSLKEMTLAMIAAGSNFDIATGFLLNVRYDYQCCSS